MTPPESQDAFDLRAWRYDQGLTRKQLADQSGVTKETIRGVEGGTLPRADTAAALARVIGRPASELFLDSGNRSEART